MKDEHKGDLAVPFEISKPKTELEKQLMKMFKVKSADSHLSLDALIKVYEGMLKKGQIEKGGAGWNRLAQLRDRVVVKGKWRSTPYAKRKYLVNPLK
tara:strand:- start:2017 stop:2307 length:291 start_codon:yes stop_codon:yes gene_type:complete